MHGNTRSLTLLARLLKRRRKSRELSHLRFTAYCVYDPYCRSWLFISHRVRASLISCLTLRWFVKKEMVISYIRRSFDLVCRVGGLQLVMAGWLFKSALLNQTRAAGNRSLGRIEFQRISRLFQWLLDGGRG